MSALKKLEELKDKKFNSDDELWEFYDSLPAADAKDVYAKYHGGDFDNGHWALGALEEAKWYGKWFRSNLDVIPLVCYNDEGKLYSNQLMNGNASIWNIEFRGKVSATMVYDGAPRFDHFRKVDENTLMGVMNGKPVKGQPDAIDKGKWNFFYLKKVAEFPVPFVE